MSDPDFEEQEQADLGSQFAEPISTPHPSLFKGMGYSNLFGQDEGNSTINLGPATPVLYGAERSTLYGAAALAHGVTAQENAGFFGVARGMSGIKDERTDAEKETEFEKTARGMAEQMAPNPATTGGVYRTVQGLSEFATKMAYGAPAGPIGAAMTTAGITQYQAYHEYLAQGVDDETAKTLANLDAGVAGLFAVSGGLGSIGISAETSIARKLMQEAAAGVTANVGLGAANRYLDHEVLERAGYTGLAAQQEVWDGQQMFMDMMMGLIPVGFAAGHAAFQKAAGLAKEMYDNNGMVRDAVSVANQAKGMSDLAPGVPVDNQSAEFHQIALRTAAAQHLAGEDINPAKGPLPDKATFVTRASSPDLRESVVSAFAQHLNEAGFNEELGGLDADTKGLIERVFGKLPEPEPQSSNSDWDALLGESENLPTELSASRTDAIEPPEPPAKATSTADLQPKRTQGPDAKRDSILQYLARHDKGLDSVEASAQGVDKADMDSREAKVGIKRAFRKGGISFDHAAEMLSEAGYPVFDEKGNYDPNVLLDRISDELAGRKSFSIRNESEFKRLEDEHFENERQAVEEQARQLIANEPDREAQDVEFMTAWRNAPVEAAKDASDRWDEASKDERLQILHDLKKATEDQHESEKTKGTGDATPEVLDLQAESGEQLQARGRRETAAAAADREAVRTAADRERADRERGQFNLTGSDRSADSDPNQMDLVQAALKERPDMMIPDADGNMVDASAAVEQAASLEDQAKAEAEAGFSAAINCLKRG